MDDRLVSGINSLFMHMITNNDCPYLWNDLFFGSETQYGECMLTRGDGHVVRCNSKSAFHISVYPHVRVSMVPSDHDVILRCYVEGYYPKSGIDMSWYKGTKKEKRIQDCVISPFADGTYRATCDFKCLIESIHEAVCHVNVNGSDFHAEASLTHVNKLIVSNTYAVHSMFSIIIMVFVVCYSCTSMDC